MMAGMLTQLPLPLLPAGAAELAPGVGLVTGDDGAGLVSVHGLATFAWDAGDEAGRRLAAVQHVIPAAAGKRRQGRGATGHACDQARLRFARRGLGRRHLLRLSRSRRERLGGAGDQGPRADAAHPIGA